MNGPTAGCFHDASSFAVGCLYVDEEAEESEAGRCSGSVEESEALGVGSVGSAHRGKHRQEELWNAITHGLMFFLSLFGSAYLLYKALLGQQGVGRLEGSRILQLYALFAELG